MLILVSYFRLYRGFKKKRKRSFEDQIPELKHSVQNKRYRNKKKRSLDDAKLMYM